MKLSRLKNAYGQKYFRAFLLGYLYIFVLILAGSLLGHYEHISFDLLREVHNRNLLHLVFGGISGMFYFWFWQKIWTPMEKSHITKEM